MNEANGYAVFLFPQALEALGEAIKPYLLDGPAGPHVLCHQIDTGGALIEMTLQGTTPDGKWVAVELMVPTSMVRMIVSSQSEEVFGFGPRATPMPGLPPVGPTGEPARAEPGAVPDSSAAPATPAPATGAGKDGAKPAP